LRNIVGNKGGWEGDIAQKCAILSIFRVENAFFFHARRPPPVVPVAPSGSSCNPRSRESINQSKILTEPHTGKEKPIPALPQGAANPASRSDTGLGVHAAPGLDAPLRPLCWPFLQDIRLVFEAFVHESIIRVLPSPTVYCQH